MSPNLTITNSAKPYPGQLLGKSIFETGDVVSHDRRTSSKVAQTRASEKTHVNDILKVLTPRERQILNWLPEGLCYKEIADKMSVHPVTVKKHVQNLQLRLFRRSVGLQRLTIFACTCSELNMRQAFRTARELVNT